MSTIPHIGFIVAAYAVTSLVMLAMVAAILIDGRAQRRLLDRLERRAPSRGGPSASGDPS